ncbi:hypothetical protein FN846DRAFT_1022190 [Sphaerosporella brunnea]|uniref:Uncharacterized protein n=1 Tax=Sphaerosporella brunnea TaxID=1250544 RepID=A0A5J5ETX2_9PEZI|nr:hypothetical protein FN846DRAFT_1022190 [Sphaerosporella brunnea]
MHLPTRLTFRSLGLLSLFLAVIAITVIYLHIQSSSNLTTLLSSSDTQLARFNATEVNEELGSGIAQENFPLLLTSNSAPSPRHENPTRQKHRSLSGSLGIGHCCSRLWAADSAKSIFHEQNAAGEGFGRKRSHGTNTAQLCAAAELLSVHSWWSHMDSVAVSWEDEEHRPYKSLHQRILEDFKGAGNPSSWEWGLKFFRYDRLALVNVRAYKDVGGWDTHIPFYSTDCDFHSRLTMRGWKQPNVEVGLVFDVGGTLDDLLELYPAGENEELDSKRYKRVLKKLEDIDVEKHHVKTNRNFWQGMQRGGQGEPFWRDAVGFEKGIRMWIEFGRTVFRHKWAHGDCEIIKAGRKFEDAWQIEWKNNKV